MLETLLNSTTHTCFGSTQRILNKHFAPRIGRTGYEELQTVRLNKKRVKD